MEKFQILFVHGGMTFKNRGDYLDYLRNKEVRLTEEIRWTDKYLEESLEERFQIIKPRMPLKDNSNYEEWKIVFGNYLNAMRDNVILVGSSLGGIFLSKYLSENKVNKKILSVYIIAAPFDNSMIGEDLAGGFELGEDLSLIEKNCDDVTLIFSKDDDCIPISHADKYRDKLKNSKIVIYESKGGHFKIGEFPEIIEMIREDVQNFIKESGLV